MGTELDTMSTDELLRLATAAFVAVMDGVKSHEIHGMTGLPESDCERIAAVRNEVFRRLDHRTLRLPNSPTSNRRAAVRTFPLEA